MEAMEDLVVTVVTVVMDKKAEPGDEMRYPHFISLLVFWGKMKVTRELSRTLE